MPQKFILTILFFIFSIYVHSQGLSCAESDPFCTGTIYEFPAGTTGSAESGPYYGCLATQPAPAWYHMKIGNPGTITIYMHSVPQRDIDFACWGPYPDPISACPYGLTSSKMVDCSYSTSWQEYCDIPNGQTGEYYILLITNYSQQPCNIIFSQTAGTGSTDCSILPPLVTNDGPLCVGETLHLHAESIANAAYAWTGPGGFSSTLQDPVIPDVTLAHAGDYACVITVFGQSSPPAITTVVINDLPDAFLLDNDTTLCAGDQAFMLVQLIGAGPFEVVYYNGSTYFYAPGLNGPVDTIFVNPPGPATYSLTQVSDTNCTRVLTGITYHVYNYPPASGVMTGGGTICEGGSAELVFNLTGSPPWNITYLINGGDPQTVTAGHTPFIIPVSPSVTTQYQFTQVYDAYCTGTASGQVLVTVDVPSGFLSGDNTICAGGTAQLIFILTGFPPWTITYTANGGDPQYLVAAYSPYSLAVSPLVSTLYEFTQLEDAFCDGTPGGQAMITIHQPSGELSGSATICAGESAQIVFQLTGTPPWSISYDANGANLQTVTAYYSPHIQSVTPSVTTIYGFTYLEDNTCPGLTSGQAQVTVNPLPSVSAGDDKTIPNGTSTILEGAVTGGSGSYTYQWQPADKLMNATVLQPTTINLSSSTLFTLTCTDNEGGCFDEDEVMVTITGGALSCISSANPNVLCRGENSQLQAIASGGSGNYTYLWLSDPPGFSSDIQSPVVTPDITTCYTLTVHDGYNVTQSNVTVTLLQLPVPNAGSDQVITYGTSATLQGGASSGSGYYNYYWEPGYKLNDPAIPNPTTVNLYETTLFTLNVTDAQTGCICIQPDAMAVIISGSALSVNPTAQPGTICSGDSTFLYSLTGGGTGIYTYSWTSDPPGFHSSASDPVVKPVMNTTYYVSVSDGYNSVSGSVGVMVNPVPLVVLGSDTTICVFDTITIDAGNEGAQYLWSNGSTARTIQVGSTGIGFESKTITVIVISPDGCISSGQRSVTFDFTACTGVGDRDLDRSYVLYPNPGNGLIIIKHQRIKEAAFLSVLNWSGRPIMEERQINFSESDNQYLLDLRPYPDGIYFIRITGLRSDPFTTKYLLLK
jgi:hypothetical protein